MNYILFLILIVLNIFLYNNTFAGIPIYGELSELSHFKRVADEELCRHPKVVIHGVRNYLRMRHLCGKDQIKIVTGVLYISEFYSEDHIYVSPLPSTSTLRKHGNTFHIIYTKLLSFYVNDLQKDLRIIHREVSSVFELDTVLPEILREAEILILLPDPIFYNVRGLSVLRYWIKRYPKVKILDLANLNIDHPRLTRINLEKRKYLQTVVDVFYRDNLVRGSIFYVDY